MHPKVLEALQQMMPQEFAVETKQAKLERI